MSNYSATRIKTSSILDRLAQITLGGAILLAPVRYRFVLFAQPIPPIYNDYTDLLLFLVDILVILNLLFWGISLALRPRRISGGPMILAIPLAGLMLASLVSAVFSVNRLLSFYHYVRLLMLTGFYLYLVNEIKSLGAIIWAIAGQVLIQAMVGIAQVLQQHSLGLKFLGEYELDPTWSGVSIVWAQNIRSLRAYGLSDHPNILGGCLAFALVLIACWYATGKSDRKIILGAVFISGLIGLLLTFSRSGWLAFLAGLLVVTWLYLRRRQFQILGQGFYLLLASLVLALPFLWHSAPYLGVRLNQGGSFVGNPAENRSLTERVALNSAGNEIFASHAITGVGLGAYPVALQQAQPVFPFYYQPPHMVLLSAAAETGIFGALFYSVLLASPWLALWVNRKRLPFTPDLIAVTGALAAISTVGFFDYYTWLLVAGRFWQWLIWGLWGAFYQLSLNRTKNV
jgi:O-antigen ligase